MSLDQSTAVWLSLWPSLKQEQETGHQELFLKLTTVYYTDHCKDLCYQHSVCLPDFVGWNWWEHSTHGGSGGTGCDCTWPPSRPGPSTCPQNQMGWCPPAGQLDHEWSESTCGPSVGRQLLFSWFIFITCMNGCLYACVCNIHRCRKGHWIPLN